MFHGLRLAVAAACLTCATLSSGCAGTSVGVGYRVYDPYYYDHHVWGPGEVVYYNQWLGETHRPNREYRRLRREDQHAYWDWRHNHR
jgi:hypothetical protein